MTQRGDVVLVNFPYSDGTGAKLRPSLVVQNDGDNARLQNTVVAMITGNITHSQEKTQVLVDPASPIGRMSGLRGPSVVKCAVLFTVKQSTIRRKLGSLPATIMQSVDAAIKEALALT